MLCIGITDFNTDNEFHVEFENEFGGTPEMGDATQPMGDTDLTPPSVSSGSSVDFSEEELQDDIEEGGDCDMVDDLDVDFDDVQGIPSDLGDQYPTRNGADGEGAGWRFTTPPNIPQSPQFEFDATPSPKLNEQLFHGSSIEVLPVCLFILSFAKFHGIGRNALDTLLTYIGEHLLPKGNKLPKTMRSMEKALGIPSLSSVTYRMCPNGCTLWKSDDENRLG